MNSGSNMAMSCLKKINFSTPGGPKFTIFYTDDVDPLYFEAECDEKPISILETGKRISFFQSHVRDENKNFFLSISCFETRTRISFFNLGHRDENENRD